MLIDIIVHDAWVICMVHLIPASQLGIKAWVCKHLGLGGHGSRTCSYGTMPRFMIT